MPQWLTVSILTLVILSPLIIGGVLSFSKYRNDRKHPYGWTKVMRDGNGSYRIMEWETPSWDWEGFEKCDWDFTDLLYDTVEEALGKSRDINEGILRREKSLEVTDI